MIDDSECIPNHIFRAIESGKAKIKKIEEAELKFQNSIRELAEKRNKKYRELIMDQIHPLLRPYALLDEITWSFSSEPENVQPSQQVRVTINGLPEFVMEWTANRKWIAFLPEKTLGSYEINYRKNVEVNDIEIFLAELHATILEQELELQSVGLEP